MKVVGYITSDELACGYVSHGLQNRVIKDFLSDKGHSYLLSWTEAKGRAPWMLRSLLGERFYEGISFFSLQQCLNAPNPLNLLKDLADKNLWIGFSLEAMEFKGHEGFDQVMNLLAYKKMTGFPRPELRTLWDRNDSF